MSRFLVALIFVFISTSVSAKTVDLKKYSKEDFYSWGGIELGDDCDSVLEKYEVKNPDSEYKFDIKPRGYENADSIFRFECDRDSWTVDEINIGPFVGWSYIKNGKTEVVKEHIYVSSKLLAIDEKFEIFRKRVRVHQFNRLLGRTVDYKDNNFEYSDRVADSEDWDWKFEDGTEINVFLTNGLLTELWVRD